MLLLKIRIIRYRGVVPVVVDVVVVVVLMPAAATVTAAQEPFSHPLKWFDGFSCGGIDCDAMLGVAMVMCRVWNDELVRALLSMSSFTSPPEKCSSAGDRVWR